MSRRYACAGLQVNPPLAWCEPMRRGGRSWRLLSWDTGEPRIRADPALLTRGEIAALIPRSGARILGTTWQAGPTRPHDTVLLNAAGARPLGASADARALRAGAS